MSLDMSPTEATILENFATGDAKPTDTIMLDDASSRDGNDVDNKGTNSCENLLLLLLCAVLCHAYKVASPLHTEGKYDSSAIFYTIHCFPIKEHDSDPFL